jgi:hypothetical protein
MCAMGVKSVGMGNDNGRYIIGLHSPLANDHNGTHLLQWKNHNGTRTIG